MAVYFRFWNTGDRSQLQTRADSWKLPSCCFGWQQRIKASENTRQPRGDKQRWSAWFIHEASEALIIPKIDDLEALRIQGKQRKNTKYKVRRTPTVELREGLDFMCKITKCRMCELYNCKSQCGGRFVIACMSRLSVGPYKYSGDRSTGGQSFLEILYSFGQLLVT